ncbi:MAG: hypothetical protein CL936_11660, partial [Deltaproteobacteria bacterium]|nr:hypothetical protein [Deltaproteobacteria bacterium]
MVPSTTTRLSWWKIQAKRRTRVDLRSPCAPLTAARWVIEKRRVVSKLLSPIRPLPRGPSPRTSCRGALMKPPRTRKLF